MPDIGALTSGLLTGLREGVEAALIVSIILAYLARSGHRRQFPAIAIGTATAIGVSFVLGVVVFATVGELRPPYDQLFEAGTMLVAAAIVTWMLFWMRRQAGAVKGSLLQRVDRALGRGSMLGLVVLAFSSILREGIETSIFLVGQVTAAGSGGAAVLVGALVGLGVAAFLGVGFYHGTRRLNLAVFFRWTGIGLIFIAAGLLSRAMHELVEIHAISVGRAPVFDVGGILPDGAGPGAFLRALLGYSSSPEAVVLAVYAAYVVAVLALYLRPTAPRVPDLGLRQRPPGDATA